VLREAFDYPYARIATILQLNEVNVRKLVSRARRHVRFGRSKSVSRGQHGRLLDAFLVAAQQGDLAAIEKIFAVAA
jgi:RNA polymerase sigma-70 factor (ECF subfamily)